MSTKIDSIYLGRMPNGAHFTYMELTIERIEEDETVKAKIAAELATLKSAFQVEDDCLKISQKNVLTNRIDSADTRRDGYYSGYKGTVKGFLKLPAGEMLDAALALDQHMTDYKIDTRAQLDRQTGMMTNFIADLETRFATQVELLGLTSFVTNMKEANDEVRALLKEQRLERDGRDEGGAPGDRRRLPGGDREGERPRPHRRCGGLPSLYRWDERPDRPLQARGAGAAHQPVNANPRDARPDPR